MISILRQRSAKHFMRSILRIRNLLIANPPLDQIYFAYGANLDINRFHNNFMKVKEIGNAELQNHELKFTLPTEYKNKSYAGVEQNLNSTVPGVLYQIDALSLRYLDTLEWCGFGAYTREEVKVLVHNKQFTSWCYKVKSPDFDRVPSKVYLNNMIKTAKQRNFPSEYIQYLENSSYKENFEIDHTFSLLFYKSCRPNIKVLLPVYKLHDRIREIICGWV